MGKLNSLFIQRATKAGRFSDGDGLYLQVTPAKTKSWIFRFMLNKRPREMGLGTVQLISLAEARLKAAEYRKLLLEGVDPIEARKAEKQTQALSDSKSMTFAECANSYVSSHRAGWKNAKHASQWTNTLQTYAHPIIGDLSVASIDTALVMRILEPIWYEKAETASRLRNRIELILSWATVRGYRAGENPARWRGHLDKLLPKRSRVQQVKHFAALPVTQMGSFIENLRSLSGVTPLGLEFQILTAARTGEVIGARWAEIDFDTAVWVIPAGRMKAKREHRVPLSSRALEILNLVKENSISDYVFSGRAGRPLSNNAFLALLKKRLKVQVTAHGFRSTFSDWAAENTSHTREAVELSLAHSIRDSTEAAYRRGDMLLKRQRLMEDWATFCSQLTRDSASLIEINLKRQSSRPS